MTLVYSEEEFKNLLHGLAEDISIAHHHYNLYKKLESAFLEFPQIKKQSDTLWVLTLTAHLGMTLHLLTKVYDQHNNALHLQGLLKTIQSNPDFLSKERFAERTKHKPHIYENYLENHTLTSLDQDISLCSSDDELVKTLIIHRGNVLAHRNESNTAKNKKVSDKHPFKHSDIEKLLKRASIIFNKYGYLYDARIHLFDMTIGHNDFRYIFKNLNAAAAK
jgi:AbiU2